MLKLLNFDQTDSLIIDILVTVVPFTFSLAALSSECTFEKLESRCPDTPPLRITEGIIIIIIIKS